MEEISNVNEKISGIFLNSGKQKKTKEFEYLKMENENKTLITRNTLENLSQLVSPFSEKSRRAKSYKSYKKVLPEKLTFIELKKIFQRNCNCHNSSYHEPFKSFNCFEVLDHDKTMPNNANYSKEGKGTQSKIQSNNINFKETRRSSCCK